MAKIISIFNNKGGVGKTTIAWNLADALARKGKKILMIDFDPQCNLSIAILGSEEFKQSLPTVTQPYGTTIRAYLQKFLQGIGNLEIYTYKGKHTHTNQLKISKKVRQQDRQIPIIFLTASDEEVNIIRGLNCGGDDYITKPFKIGELCPRIRALLRRTHNSPQTTITNPSAVISGRLTIDLTASRVTLNGRPIELTKAEYRLLTLLAGNANQVVTREIILNELWDSAGDFVDDNTLSVYVRRLREKIEPDPSHPKYLTTVRGFGYRWEDNP